MANTKQAEKRVRQNVKRRLHNTKQESEMRTHVKNVVKQAEADTVKAKTTFSRTTKLLDQAARRGQIHPNKAARLKSRLNKKLKAAAAK